MTPDVSHCSPQPAGKLFSNTLMRRDISNKPAGKDTWNRLAGRNISDRLAGSAIALLVAVALLGPSCSRAPEPKFTPGSTAAVDSEPRVRVALQAGLKSAAVGAEGTLYLDAEGRGGVSWSGGGSCSVYLAGGSLSAQGPDGAVIDVGAGALEVRSSAGVVSLEGRKYRGSMRIVLESDGTLTAINVVGLESYLQGVLRSEIGALAESRIEAMKAQAVASRSYTLFKIASSSDRSYDVVCGVGDQVYKGLSGEREVTNRAVAETLGEVAVCDGEPVRANFSSTCGGVTVNNEDAWPDEDPLPYLRSIRDAEGRRGDGLCAASKYYRWREEWSVDDLESILSSHYVEASPEGGRFTGRLTGLEVVERTGSGRARVVRIETDEGEYEVRADKMRWALRRPDGGPLRSTFFDLELEKRRGEVRRLVAEGRGWGHGVGMCQWGAIGMADRGRGYKAILHHYYTDIDIVKMYGRPA